MKGRLSITEVAKTLGVTPRTIMRWEKSGKIKRSKRDWRGWRFYAREDVEEIRNFYESSYEYAPEERTAVSLVKETLAMIIAMASILYTSVLCSPLYAEVETMDIVLEDLPVVQSQAEPLSEPIKYTLGTNDIISIDVRRHPEFSGQYVVNSEGKIEYKFVGDIIVAGLTKTELRDRLTEILTDYLIEPKLDVQIVSYLSKVFYVVGDVSSPGKFYMRGDTITVREALVQSGLPTHAAAMRRCRLITPDEKGRNNFLDVNVYSLLFEGNLRQNLVMKPGDVLYVPATIMAKIIRIISPVSSVVGEATGTAAKGAAVAAVAL